MTFDEIYTVVEEIIDLCSSSNTLIYETKSKKNNKKIEELQLQIDKLKFELELPYKLLNLFAEAYKENVEVWLTNIDNDLKIKLRADRYNNEEFNLSEINITNYYELQEIVTKAKNKRLEQEHKQQLKEIALSKLTKEEKEVLGLN